MRIRGTKKNGTINFIALSIQMHEFATFAPEKISQWQLKQ